MKTKILTFLFLLVSAFVVTANGENIKLVVQQSNGETTSLKLNDQPVVTFTEDEMVATTQNSQVNFPLSNVGQILYETSQQHVAIAQGIVGGTISVDNPDAEAGETVTVTVTPDADYQIAKSDIVAEATIDPGSAQAPSLMAVGPGVGMIIELVGDDPADLRQERTYTFTMPDAPYNVLITAKFTAVTYYNVTVANIENGSVEVDKTRVMEGETVNLTVTPATGYEVDEVYYMNGSTKVEITGNSFTMPAADVTVYATFKPIPAMYLIGSFNEWNEGTKVPLTKNADGKWVGTQAMEANATFKFMDENGTWIGAQSNGECIVQYEYVKNGAALWMTSPGQDFKIPVAGTWTFTVDRDASPMTVIIRGDWYFNIEVVAPTNGTLSADKTQALEEDQVTLTITPNTGFAVDEVYYMKGDQKVPIEGNTFNMPDGDVKVYATFKAIGYTITIASNIQNGAVEAPATANYGDEVEVTATPATGYELETLTYTVEGAEPQAIENGKFTMPAANVTINATFKKVDYTITIASNIQNGTVEAPATANYGDEVEVTVTPAEGYELETLTYTVEGAEPEAIENGKFAMPAANVTINATFKKIGYTITVVDNIQNGTVEAPATANYGDEVTVTVTPATGYELETLTYTVEGAEPQAIENGKFTMPAANVTINATFKKVDYTITVASNIQNGTVTAPATANYGDEVTLTITPAEGYVLETLTYTVEGAEPVDIENGKFTMPAANVTINATFAAITYNIIIEDSENGSVTADKNKAAEGSKVTLTISPDTEFELDVLTVDGEPVEVTGNTYEFDMPNHDVTVTATFKPVVHTFTVVGKPAELFGSENEWDLNNENGEMTLGDDGLYTWTSEPTFLEGNVDFKVVKDHSWNATYPAGDNYVIPGLKPGTYTVTITLNPETGEITVNVEGSADVYVLGDVNGNTFAPNAGVKMTTEDGKIYTATVTTIDKEYGYGFFAFTHKLGADANDWNTANYYRFMAQSNGNFLVNGATMNVELAMAYNGDNSMKIPAGEYTLTVDLENMKLTITGGTQLSYILSDGVEDVDYTIINDLAVVDRSVETSQFFTSDGNNNWITIKGGNFFADALLADGFKGGHVSGVFSDKNLNPFITLSVAPEESEDVMAVEPKTYLLAEEFTPKVDEVIIVSKAYYKASENTLRAYAPNNSVQGQSLTIDTSLYNYDFRDGYKYTVKGVVNIKEPWAAVSGIGLMDYDYPFQNYKLLVLDADEEDVPTSINGIFLEEGVKSVRYFNVAGVESNVPFQGVNIIVKEMEDGSIVTTKAIK